MKRRSFLNLITASAFASLFSVSQVQADVLASVLEKGVLTVAVPQDFPPFGSVGSDLAPIGYDIDMARLIADDLGVEVELVPVTSANRIPYLTTGKVDLIISSLGKNPDRAKVIDFSDAYAPFFNGVFGPEDVAVSDVSGLSGKIVGVTRGSVEDLELSEIAPDDVSIKRFEDNNGTISAYLTGQADLIATGNVVAAAINEQTDKRELTAKFLIKNSPCYVGVAKSEEAFMSQVNEIIAAAKSDGRLASIAETWLQQPLPADL